MNSSPSLLFLTCGIIYRFQRDEHVYNLSLAEITDSGSRMCNPMSLNTVAEWGHQYHYVDYFDE